MSNSPHLLWFWNTWARQFEAIELTDKCETCGADGQELRPYGPKGEWICFACAMKDEKTTAQRYYAVVFGEETH